MPIQFTPSQAQGLKNIASKANKAEAISMAIQIAGDVGAKYITTIYEVKNEKERQRIVAQLQELDEKQLSDLADNLNKITDSNARLQELTSYLTKSVSTKLSTDISGRIQKQNLSGVVSERKKIYIAVGVALGLFLTIIVVKRIIK